MSIVLVHGVPETASLWEPLRAELGRDDVVALALPGFGCPRPDGFGATKDEYADWLAGELERLGRDGPIDLVGHDWGGGFTVRVVSTRPELVRSWVSDAAGIGNTDFEWHDFAKIWQTPGEGEAFWEQQLAMPAEERAGVFEAFGVPHDLAVGLGGQVDRTMTECILALYRSATTVGREWGPDFEDVPAPGLVLLASEDAFLSESGTRSAARRAGATVAELEGLGHWWMLQDPARGAKALQAFWASLD
ncbi:MAG: alpha/beta hydrolase [Acidimicrobiia bacterium]|nr:alpha/beta hydrolase [Acidimicrobiia bacterium]